MRDEMDVKVQSFEALFGTELHCVVPIFQRPYVWNEEEQWDPLWEDIEQTATEYLEHLQESDGNETEAANRTRRHFMGAIVLQQEQTPIGQPKQVQVIDGQQRLTTIQLLLNAASEVYTSRGYQQHSAGLDSLVQNRRASGPTRFKLRPSADDQAAFQAAMSNDWSTGDHRDSPVVDCHRYFKQTIDNWIATGEREYTEEARAHALFVSLYGLLKLAVIELSERDDPYIIFETLNARGTPLTPGNLVKNYILQVAGRDIGADEHDEFYRQFWKPLEADYWRKEARTGALIRSQLDAFLQYWLVSTVLKDVRFESVFPTFKEHAEQLLERGRSIGSIAEEVNQAAGIYKSWSEYPAHSPRAIFFRRGRMCGLGGMSPLLLYIDTQPHSVLGEEQKLMMFICIESYLVRRALCRAITAGLNRISVEAMRRLNGEEPAHWPAVLSQHFASLRGSLRWPTDAELTDSLQARPVSGRVGRGRLRMVLSAIEEHHRDTMAFVPDSTFSTEGLSIEHIMPRRWQEHWQIDYISQETVDHRDKMVDTLGNLTLVNSGLNSSISNGPWSRKRTAIAENSTLYMNREICAHETWDETTIGQRGEALVEQIIDIWPRPRG